MICVWSLAHLYGTVRVFPNCVYKHGNNTNVFQSKNTWKSLTSGNLSSSIMSLFTAKETVRYK